MHYNYKKLSVFTYFLLLLFSFPSYGNESYFDLSDPEIEIQTNFEGKEVIIFGLSDPNYETIINIVGPKQNARIRMKERFFGFWFNTKKITYKDLPSLFFVASSKPIKEILNDDTIIKNSLYFEEMIVNKVTQRNFNFADKNKFNFWNNNLIKIKKEENFYKEYKIKIVDDKLFQTRIFFPSNTIPGIYDVNIFQIKNKIIVSQNNKKIIIKKAGIGNKIYEFANDHPASYGIVSIMFAIIAGLVAATAFRRL
tara:strand:+ start:276 stop:1034 length:759 start_codon:yes stop_codon:yes gene_type:complete